MLRLAVALSALRMFDRDHELGEYSKLRHNLPIASRVLCSQSPKQGARFRVQKDN